MSQQLGCLSSIGSNMINKKFLSFDKLDGQLTENKWIEYTNQLRSTLAHHTIILSYLTLPNDNLSFEIGPCTIRRKPSNFQYRTICRISHQTRFRLVYKFHSSYLQFFSSLILAVSPHMYAFVAVADLHNRVCVPLNSYKKFVRIQDQLSFSTHDQSLFHIFQILGSTRLCTKIIYKNCH